jgi:hypothetical protein
MEEVAAFVRPTHRPLVELSLAMAAAMAGQAVTVTEQRPALVAVAALVAIPVPAALEVDLTLPQALGMVRPGLAAAPVVADAAAQVTPLDLALGLACLVRRLLAMAALDQPQTVQAVLVDPAAQMLPNQVLLLLVTFTVLAPHQYRVFMAVVVAVLTTLLLNRQMVAVVQYALSGGPTGPSPVLIPETCNYHGY